MKYILFIFITLIFMVSIMQCKPKENSKSFIERDFVYWDKTFKSGGFEIIFDQSNEQVYSPFDFGFSGMSRLGRLLSHHAIEVSLNSKPLHMFLPGLEPMRKVLVLGLSLNRSYKKADVIAIKNYIKKGGSVLVLAEHDNFFKNADMQNELLQGFGIRVLHGRALNKGMSLAENTWPRSHSKVLGIKDVYVYLPVALQLKGKVRPFLELDRPVNMDKSIIGAVKEYGKGKLCILGDAEIFWNMTRESGIRKGRNEHFILYMFKYLAPLGSQKVSFKLSKTVKPLKGNKRALFHRLNVPSFRFNTVGGLDLFAKVLQKNSYNIEVLSDTSLKYKPNDLVVVACPRFHFFNHDLEHIRKADKILIISDGQTDIISEEPSIINVMKKMFKIEMIINEYKNPLNALLKGTGAQISAGTIVSKGDNHFNVTSIKGKRTFKLYRSSCVFLKTNSLFKSLVQVNAPVWLTLNYTPAMMRGKQETDVFPPAKTVQKQRSYAIVVKNKKYFLVADLELLGNQHFNTNGKYITKEILKWLTEK